MIVRNFPVTRGERTINYPFTTFPIVLQDYAWDNEDFVKMAAYLRDTFIYGCETLDDSISQGSELMIKTEHTTDHSVIQYAGLADYRGAGSRQHDIVQQYMLKNDPLTIATEIPVCDREEKKSGHIDLIRMDANSGKIQIWDFKPNAHREKKAASQVWRYMAAIARATGIKFDHIVGGYFDDTNAYIIKN